MAALSKRALDLSIVLALFAALLWGGRSSASYTVEYCSSINTASTSANYSNYQSNGLCGAFCDGYSYAVLQDYACWCSDYTPASSTNVDLSECDTGCPGYPEDPCGKEGEYFIYLFMNQSPSGTKGSSSSTTSSTQANTSLMTETVQSTETIQRTTTVQVALSPSKSPSTNTSSGEDNTGTLATITTSGVVQTVTLDPDGSIRQDSSSERGLSTGAAVGIAVGVVIVVTGIAGFFFFLWWKKRREPKNSSAEPSPRSSSAGMVSTMASMAETNGQPGTRRGSKFIPIDDRMEFHHDIYARGDAPSRESVDSLRDDVDYSRRVLRATNPDPPARE